VTAVVLLIPKNRIYSSIIEGTRPKSSSQGGVATKLCLALLVASDSTSKND